MNIENEKAIIFVRHIKRHLIQMELENKIRCKICDKDIDKIYEEEKGEF